MGVSGGGGFLDTGGTITGVNDPIGTSTIPIGITDGGVIVGYYYDAASANPHGFLDNGGTFVTIDVPGALQTLPLGINDQGQVVGDFYNGTGYYHGFLYAGGTFTTITGPNGLPLPDLRGINDHGQIVGEYPSGSGGILGTPTPEPGTLLLLGTGVVGLQTRRKKQWAESRPQ